MSLHLPAPPIGAKIFFNPPAWKNDVATFHGVSFCAAITEAAGGEPQMVLPGSIDTCRWVPAVLGLSEPQSAFEKDIAPALPPGDKAVYLARLDRFRDGETPDVVIVRAAPEQMTRLAQIVGWDMAAWEYVEEDRIARSALKRLRENDGNWRTKFVKPFNRTLAAMEKAPGWGRATRAVFKSRMVSAALEAFISRTVASMSMCRNSLVIPHLSGRFNISYFCSGGITWGGNSPLHMTSGWPWPLWRRLERELTWD